MKKKYIFILVLLFITISNVVYSQNDTIPDSLKVNIHNKKVYNESIDSERKHRHRRFKFRRDSTDRDTTINIVQQRTEQIVSSLFGESRKLDNADSIINSFDGLPSFGIYKDNFFIVGTELFGQKTKANSDAKFQISIRQRLTNSTLPFKTYVFLTYTQKAFWDVFRESFPFKDLNFNPSIGLGRAIVYDNRLLGALSLQFEHESNGKDRDDSRSWNKISLGSIIMFNDYWSLQSSVWIPIVDGDGNKDIVRYSGWGNIGVNYISDRKKYMASIMLTKRGGGNLNANIVANFAIRIFNDDNQYLFAEYYNGYGESMLEYNRYRQRVRIGIVIKPTMLNLF